MKLSTKIFLPIILISALLISLTGCFGVPADDSPGFTPGSIKGTMTRPEVCCGEPSESSLVGDAISPNVCDDLTLCDPQHMADWYAWANVKVTLTNWVDCEEVELASTMTDENGNYLFENVPAGKNYIITAICPEEIDFKVKDVAEEVVAGSSYNAGIADAESTVLALCLEGLGEICLDSDVLSLNDFRDHFKYDKVICEVCDQLAECSYALPVWVCEITELCPGYVSTGGGDDDDDEPADPCAGHTAPHDISLDVLTAIAGCSYSGTVSATDDDGDTLTFSLIEGIGDMAINPNTGVITWNPTCEDICSCNRSNSSCELVKVTVSDPCDSVDVEFCIEVTNSKPEIKDIGDVKVAALCCIKPIQAVASDPDEPCQTLTYSLSCVPAVKNGTPICTMKIDKITGEITWCPTCDEIGDYKVTVTVTDDCGASASTSFGASVTNDEPKIQSIDGVKVAALCCIDPIQVDAFDPDEPCQTLTYSLSCVPAVKNGTPICTMKIDKITGEITWCPTCDEIGDYKVTVTVTDDCGASASTSFGASVTNDPPKIKSIDGVKVAALCCIDPIQVDAFDPDEPCQTLTYSISGEPKNMKMDKYGEITWCPTCDEIGDYKVTVTVTDDCGAFASTSFPAAAYNSKPTIESIDDVSVAVSVDALCCIDPIEIVASDPDEPCQTLKYTIESVPKNSMYIKKGYIYWCPTCDEIGDYKVTVTVTDDCGLSNFTTFTATAYNNLPAITNVEFENDFIHWQSGCTTYKVVIEDSKTLRIFVTAEDGDDCQELVFSLNAEDGDDPLPPVGLMYGQVGNEFKITFNANCYDECIPCEPDSDRAGKDRCWICDCWWHFVVRVTDGCATDEVDIWVCVADIIN